MKGGSNATIAENNGGSTEFTGAIEMRSGSNQFDDYDIETGVFKNAGAGWNTFKFRESFDKIPVVTVTAQGFRGCVEITSVSETGFLYCLSENVLVPGSVTGANNVVTSVKFSTMIAQNTAADIAVNYVAITYEGER